MAQYPDQVVVPTHIAERVKVLRMGRPKHSWRALSGVICKEFPDFIRANYGDPELLFEDQMLGADLCRDSAESLGLEPWSID